MSFGGFIEPRSSAIHKFGSTNRRGVESEASVGLLAFYATVWSNREAGNAPALLGPDISESGKCFRILFWTLKRLDFIAESISPPLESGTLFFLSKDSRKKK